MDVVDKRLELRVHFLQIAQRHSQSVDRHQVLLDADKESMRKFIPIGLQKRPDELGTVV